MFSKKCKKCSSKLNKDFEFCPYCGFNVKRDEEERNYGMLGKDDNISMQNIGIRMPFGFDRIFNSLLGQIDSQFKDLDKEM